MIDRSRAMILVVSLPAIGFACTTPAPDGEGGVGGDGMVSTTAVDAIFAGFSGGDSPGCAVAVSQDGRATLARAYGLANLEHDIPNTPETVFEPGSVSKQFTAAATVLLALDGKISLDDDIREYLPELPDYHSPITVRMLLNHTSGLRDWGSIAAIEGWPRTTRIHTHKHMLDIASRQKSLNYTPGEFYSYTNTGYNLQAVLIERVTGMSFEEFSKARIFEPLGMTKTEWRDDFTEIVENRSVGYVPGEDDEWHMLMPFENVHGNGGLLTTVGDLLKFTHNLDTGDLGGPRFLEEMHRQGVLNSGRQISYASGLFVGEYKGVREVQHSGGTAAYRGFLTRFPDHGLAVSVMCNAGNANPGRFAHEVAELYLGDGLVDPSEARVEGIRLAPDQLDRLAAGYRNMRTNSFVRLTVADGGLSLGGLTLTPLSETRFESANGVVLAFEAVAEGAPPAAVLSTPEGDEMRLERVEAFAPTAAQLGAYVGSYHSDEAEVTYRVAVEDGQLNMVDRYGDGLPLEPVYSDGFEGPFGTLIFRRDGAGAVNGFSVSQGRVWDLRFERIAAED